MAKIKDASGEKQIARVTVNLTDSTKRQFDVLLKIRQQTANDFLNKLIQKAIESNADEIRHALIIEKKYSDAMQKIRQKTPPIDFEKILSVSTDEIAEVGGNVGQR